MMKAFYYLCLFAGLTFGTLTFTACGDDDGDSGKSEVPNVGTSSQASVQ